MSLRETDPCALYRGEDYVRCRRFHAEVGKEMRQYRTSELAGLGLAGIGILAALGLTAVIVYGVYTDRRGD